ncbi:MAG: sodium-dependent transporter [Akkermansia sp.]|nr:sodium-dependent transporter [Akkermansia sp.]
MSSTPKREHWNSNLGVVLAVAGSAVGFGNFLRFPGLAAQYGGGAFMIAYFTAFLLLGIPLSWVEWTIGRRGGRMGGHTTASIFSLIARSTTWKYLGLAGVLAPLAISMYYMYLEGWTLGYAWHTAVGDLSFSKGEEFGSFFGNFVGANAHGAIFSGQSTLPIFFLIALLCNFYLIFRGVSKGIEWFCKLSMPILLITAVIVLVRVLTLGTPDAAHPERSVNEGLGYMWNPDKTLLVTESGKTLNMVPASATPEQEQELLQRTQAEHPGEKVSIRRLTLIDGLLNPELWITAAGQIFFSLSIGFGAVCTYASYVRKNRDIALASLTANAANEVVEVGIAGMMIVPAAVSLLGVVAAAGAGTFGLGFNVLPQVFASMPMGQLFGTLFFFLLFLAAITSSLSMIQPATAFLEEFWGLRRVQSVTIVAFFMTVGAILVAWFTGDNLIALDTMDFWFGTLSLYLITALFLVLFNAVWHPANALRELGRGALIVPPRIIGFIIRWITPTILLCVFGSWLYKNIFVELSPQVSNVLEGKPGAIFPLAWLALLVIFCAGVAHTSKHFRRKNKEQQKERLPIS